MQKLIQASRKEIEVTLQFAEGFTANDLPKDIFGHVFFNSVVGTVNSGGLPYPESFEEAKEAHDRNEFGSPIMNGDGMILRIDFDQAQNGVVTYKTGLLKPPDYYADEATKKGSKLRKKWGYKLFHFGNAGLIRMSDSLGSRNLMNTAVVPIRYEGDKQSRLYATFDGGRPYEFDPVSLKLISPIGWNHEWRQVLPKFFHLPFAPLTTTAHPSFDPETKEFFGVNFTRSLKNLMWSYSFSSALKKYPHHVHKEVDKLHADMDKINSHEERQARLEDLYTNIHKKIRKHKSWWQRIKDWFAHIFKEIGNFLLKIKKDFMLNDEVYLMHWDGKSPHIQKFRLVDEEGNPLVIHQCMHQTNLSEDFIILMNSSFKFTLDQMYDFPLWYPLDKLFDLDRKLREFTTIPLEANTDTYLVSRKEIRETIEKIKNGELPEGTKTIKAIKVQDGLDVECVHFSANYANPAGPNGEKAVTLFTINNSCNCVAEWVRPYDELKFPGNNSNDRNLPDGMKIDPNLLGMFALGDMGVDRLGKYTIQVNEAENEARFLPEADGGFHLTGIGDGLQRGDDSGLVTYNGEPTTWALNLYSYRGIISPTETVNTIKDVYVHSYGLSPKLLTKFIYDLYEDYPNRMVGVNDIGALTQQEIPSSLFRVSFDNMQQEDAYVFDKDVWPRSLQYVNKNNGGNGSTDGYIVFAVVAPHGEGSDQYRSEIWIFDGEDLKKGPICKLFHPEMIFALPIHAAWLPEIQPVTEGYKINIREDYNEQIAKMIFPWRRRKIKKFFNKYVYPHFD